MLKLFCVPVNLFRGSGLIEFSTIGAMVDILMPFLTPIKSLVLCIGWRSDEIIEHLDQPIMLISGTVLLSATLMLLVCIIFIPARYLRLLCVALRL